MLILCPLRKSQADLRCQDVSIDWKQVNQWKQRQITPSAPILTSVRFLPRLARGGRNLLVSSADGQICFGSLEAGQSLLNNIRCQRLVERTGNVWQLSVAPDGSKIGLAGFDGTLHLFQRRSGDHLQRFGSPLRVSAGPLTDVSFSPQDGNLAAVSLDGTASLWDRHGRRLAIFPGEEERGGGFMKAAFSADGRQLLLATTQGSLKVRDVEDLPMLLRRGCKALDSFVANPATDDSVKKRLSFCSR
jgi:WD40 repeat protein